MQNCVFPEKPNSKNKYYFKAQANRPGKANILHTVELYSKCFKMYPDFQGCMILQARVKSFIVE